jgi:hypothetical protein
MRLVETTAWIEMSLKDLNKSHKKTFFFWNSTEEDKHRDGNSEQLITKIVFSCTIFLRFFTNKGKIFDLLFWVWGMKQQLMASKLPKRKKLLDTPGAQGSRPKRSIPDTL